MTLPLDILRCPVTQSSLSLSEDGQMLTAAEPVEDGRSHGLRYRVDHGIPVLLPEEALLPEGYASLSEFKARHGLA